MKGALLKDSFREITRNFGRFMSIFLIVLIGTAFFSGIKASAPDMKNTADKYYDDYNMMDLRMLSTIGLENEDITAIKETPGVESVQPGYFTDVVSQIGLTEFVFRVNSLPNELAVSPDMEFINMPNLIAGRFPQNSGECIIEESRNIDLGLKLGDTITVSTGTEKNLSDSLKTDTLTIVGFAESPYYLTFDKEASEIGNGKVNFFMMVLEQDFNYPVYTEALILVTGAKELNCYSDEYQKLVDNVASKLENMSAERSTIRLAKIKQMANEELNKAKAELANAEAQFNAQIAGAQANLEAAQNKLVSGQATLDANKASYEEQINAANAEISTAEEQLRVAQNQYDTGLEMYNQTIENYGDELAQLDNITANLTGIQQNAQTQIDALTVQLANDPNLTDEQRQTMQQQIDSFNNIQTSANTALSSLTEVNSFAQSQMAAAEAQITQARNYLDSSWARLDQAKVDLANKQIEAENAFAEAERQIAAGQTEYDQAKAEFDVKKAQGAAELQAQKERVIRAEGEIERLNGPSFYVLDRNFIYSYADFKATADSMDALAKLFPVFFVLVAGLVCLTTITRMVDEQRSTIGIYKAIGYNSRNIAFKFINYAALSSFFGGVIGVSLGVRIFPEIVFNSWKMMYALPPLEAVPQYGLMILTVIAGVAVTTLSAYAACRNALRETPALLMRPKAPKPGKKIFLEGIPGIWKRLNFSQKVTARNIFRYKKRFFMTVIGIAGCTALLVAALGLNNSISQIVNKQYKEIFTFDMSTKFSPQSEQAQKQEVIDLLSNTASVNSVLKITQASPKIKSDGEEISVTMISPENSEEFLNYVSLQDRGSGEKLLIPDRGIVITEKLAKELGVNVGETVTVNNGEGYIKKMEVADITENYVFHYIYLDANYYEEIFGVQPEYNSLMIKLNDTSNNTESNLGKDLVAFPQVSSVNYYSDAASKFQETVKSLNAIVYVIILCAGLLAFIVLYNLTIVNISERIREIATIKVLGLYNREVATYVYRENMILSVIGAVVGLLLGIYLHRIIMTSIEQKGIMFGYYINGWSFLNAFLLTMVFGILVNIFMYPSIQKIPMVESLKTIE